MSEAPTRLDRTDPDAHLYEVYLNGEKLSHCIRADVKLGAVLCGPGDAPILLKSRAMRSYAFNANQFINFETRGNVDIVPAGTDPATLPTVKTCYQCDGTGRWRTVHHDYDCPICQGEKTVPVALFQREMEYRGMRPQPSHESVKPEHSV